MPHLLERIFGAFLLVAVTRHIDNIKCTAAKDRVFLHQLAQGLRLFDAGNHPEGMAEQVAVFLVGIRIVAVRVVFCNQVQKAPNIAFVDKIAHLCSSWHGLVVVFDITSPDTEKLPEIERLILQLHIAFIGEDFSQIVGIDFQLRQLVVGVGIAKVQLVPLRFALLLHHIVPGVDVIVEFLENVEGSTRQGKELGIVAVSFLYQIFNDIITQGGGGSFMGLIHDDQIPVQREHSIVLIEFTANGRRTTQILNGGKIDELFAAIKQTFDGSPVALGAVGIIIGIIKDLLKILIPAIVHHRAVSNNNGLGKASLLNHLKGREGFAETHLCVPEHSASRFELLQRFLDGFFLLRAEHNGSKSCTCTHAGQVRLAFFHRFDRFQNGGQLHLEPFSAGGVFQLLLGNAGVFKHTVDVVVPESFQYLLSTLASNKTDGQLGM